MIKEMGKELIDWFKRKDRCYVSTLAYIFCGILSFFAVASLISPFSINVCERVKALIVTKQKES